jgi:hypothetical protein
LEGGLGTVHMNESFPEGLHGAFKLSGKLSS